MIRFFLHCLLAILPCWLKLPIYRRFCGFEIGRGARIGFSPLAVASCRIEDEVRIGHFNLFWNVGRVRLEDNVRVGHLNVFRGGNEVRLGRYSELLRANVVNSIIDAETEQEADPRFHLGDGSIVTTGHWIDFTDRVTIGQRSILGGRHSSIWTHSRQWTRPVEIGSFVYLGSEVRLAPGAVLPSRSVVALGSVVVDQLEGRDCLIGGNPARFIKALDERGRRMLYRKTRPDLPEEIGCEERREDLELVRVGDSRRASGESA